MLLKKGRVGRLFAILLAGMVKLSLWTHFNADFDCGNDDNFHVFCSAASAHCGSLQVTQHRFMHHVPPSAQTPF